MKYYEYNSPDDRVLFNCKNNSHGKTIICKTPLILYLIPSDLAKYIFQYKDVEDMSQVPMLLDGDNTFNIANIEEYIQTTYKDTCSEVLVTEKDTNDLVK